MHYLIYFLGLIIFIYVPTLSVYSISAFIPFWIEWELTDIYNINLGLADFAIVASLIGFSVKSKLKLDKDSKCIFIIILFFTIWIALSIILNPFEGYYNTKMLIWRIYKSTFLYISFMVFYYAINSKRNILMIYKLILLSSTLVALIGILQVFLNIPITIKIGDYWKTIPFHTGRPLIGRAFGTLTHSNEFGAFLVFPLISCITFLLHKCFFIKRTILVSIIAILSISLLLTFSRGSWAAAIFSFILLCLLSKAFKKSNILYLLTIILMLSIAGKGLFPNVDLFPGEVSKRLFSMKDPSSDVAMAPRFIRWSYYFDRALEKPFFGHSVISDSEASSYLDNYALSTHNTYLSFAMKYGIIGLFMYLIILYRFLHIAYNMFIFSDDQFFKLLFLSIFTSFFSLFLISAQLASIFEDKQLLILLMVMMSIVYKYNYFSQPDSA